MTTSLRQQSSASLSGKLGLPTSTQHMHVSNKATALRELQRQGVVGHVGIGCVEHEVHLAMMSRADAHVGVLLSVNDFNLLRRYGASGSWGDAAARDVGVLNAGAFYMGLLACCLCGGIYGFLVHVAETEVSLWPFDKLWERASSGPTWASSSSGTTSTGTHESTREEVNAAI